MIHSSAVLSIAICLATSTFCDDRLRLLHSDEVVFEDRFEGKLAEGWEWIREEADHWHIHDDALEIRVMPGLADTVVNALVREMPDRNSGAYAIEVDLTSLSEPIQQYEQAGLTIYQDGKPVFKFVKELVDGQLMIVPGRKPFTSKMVQLRLVVTGNSYTAQYRAGGDGEFQTAATGELQAPNKDQISLQCYHGPPEKEHWFRFDNFRIIKLEK